MKKLKLFYYTIRSGLSEQTASKIHSGFQNEK
jgi:hypothetical protein